MMLRCGASAAFKIDASPEAKIELLDFPQRWCMQGGEGDSRHRVSVVTHIRWQFNLKILSASSILHDHQKVIGCCSG